MAVIHDFTGKLIAALEDDAEATKLLRACHEMELLTPKDIKRAKIALTLLEEIVKNGTEEYMTVLELYGAKDRGEDWLRRARDIVKEDLV